NGLARDIAQIVSSVLGIGGGGGLGQQIVPSGRTATSSAFGTTGGAGGASPFGGGGGPFGGGTSGSTSLAGGSGMTGGVGSTGAVSGSSFGGTSSRTSGTGAAKTGATTTGATTGATSGPPKPGGIFTGEVMVIADEVNNAIVVRANAVDYGKIKKTIETLDIVPRAVLIEVLVAEVDLTKDFA